MNQRLHQRLTPLLVLLPLLLVGCEQRGQLDQPRTPQGKSEPPLATLEEHIEVLQEQQQAASQTLDQLRGASGEMQPYLQAHFISTWKEETHHHAWNK